MITNHRPLDPLNGLDPQDLSMLLISDPEQLLGLIMELNHAPRYHNRLNAIALLGQLLELRRELEIDDAMRRAS